jgi:type IV pilus assembly protein PilB
MSEELRALTLERAPSDKIVAVAMREGMRRLREDGLDKVKSGVTSMAEIARVTGGG